MTFCQLLIAVVCYLKMLPMREGSESLNFVGKYIVKHISWDKPSKTAKRSEKNHINTVIFR